MRQVFVIAIIATLFTACKNNKKGTETTDTDTTTTTTTTTNAAMTWDEQTKAAFINECINNSKDKMPEDQARKVCNCMQSKIEEKYPNYADAAALTMQQMNDMAKECVE